MARISANYDLLNNDNLNVSWHGSTIELQRPLGINHISKLNFRSFKGDLLPFTNLNLPTLKTEIILTSEGISEKTITGSDNVYSPEEYTYKTDKINKIIEFSKEWTYESSADSQLALNINECIEEANRRLITMYPIIGFGYRYNIDSTDKMIYSDSNAEVLCNFSNAFIYKSNNKLIKKSANSSFVVSDSEIYTLNNSYDYVMCGGNDYINFVVYFNNDVLHVLLMNISENKTYDYMPDNDYFPSDGITYRGIPNIIFYSNNVLVGHSLFSCDSSEYGFNKIDLSAELEEFNYIHWFAFGHSSENYKWFFYGIEPITRKQYLYSVSDLDLSAGVLTVENLDSEEIEIETIRTTNLYEKQYGGETYELIIDDVYLLFLGSVICKLDENLLNAYSSYYYMSSSTEGYYKNIEGLSYVLKSEINDLELIYTYHGNIHKETLQFETLKPIHSLGYNCGSYQIETFNFEYSDTINPEHVKNAYRMEASLYRDLKSSGMINTLSDYATDDKQDLIQLSNLIVEPDENDQIRGTFRTSEICYESNEELNIAIRIFTDPYWFEVYTPIEYFESSNYSLSHPTLNLNYAAINRHILRTVELLILMKYEYNDLVFKCFQFSNYDNVVFHLNEEAQVDFKRCFIDNSTMKLICKIVSDDGELTLEDLKLLYGRITVSIDWEE